jgi:hypothetical protein
MFILNDSEKPQHCCGFNILRYVSIKKRTIYVFTLNNKVKEGELTSSFSITICYLSHLK